MRRKSYAGSFILAVALCSIALIAAFAFAQTTDTGTATETTQPSTQVDQTQPSTQPSETTGTTTPSGTGAGPSETPAETPAGAITVPQGQPCPPGYVPQEAQPAQPTPPSTTEETTTTEQEEQAVPAGPGTGPSEMETQRTYTYGGTTGVRRAPMRARYGMGPSYMPRAGVDFSTLAVLGSTLLGAGLAIKRRMK